MPYRLLEQDATVEAGVRRVATEQIDRAIRELSDKQLETHEIVHQVRKRCKKLRGLIRLVRPVFEDYSKENVRFRDAARPLSFVRDSEALIETYDALIEAYEDQIDRKAFASIRRRLTLRQKEIVADRDLDGKISDFRAAMLQAKEQVRHWQLDADGADAVTGGLRKTYKRAVKAMAAAEKASGPEAMHEWRKRVKYHWYHTRLLTSIWPPILGAHEDAADELGDALGNHHDLVVFRQTVVDDPKSFGSETDIEVLLGLIERRQQVLVTEAFRLGQRLLAEPPDALAQRWRIYWNVWRRELTTGEAA